MLILYDFFYHQFLNPVTQIIIIVSSCRGSRTISKNSSFIFCHLLIIPTFSIMSGIPASDEWY